MITPIIRNERDRGRVYITGHTREFSLLFGYPPPILPEGENKPGTGEIIQVMMPPELDTLAGRYIGELKKLILESKGGNVQSPEFKARENEYAGYLGGLLKHTARSDRRAGTLNLFWLAHLKNLGNIILDSFASGSGIEKMKYRLWPMFSGLLRRTQGQVFRSLGGAEKRNIAFNLGRDMNWGLIDSLLEDQFALMEKDVRFMDPGFVMGPFNSHYRMEGSAFSAVISELSVLFDRDKNKNDAAFRRMVLSGGGFYSHEDYFGQEDEGEPSLYQSNLIMYYLGSEETIKVLKKNRNVRYLAGELGGWNGFVEEFLRVVQALKRSEYIQFLQEFITIIPGGLDDSDIKDMFLEGRLYKYSLNLPVANNNKRVVILFADIREFTRTSEMAISERELTEKLYDVFDPLVHIVVSLGGTVDKFTGDGMMITFGAIRSLPDINLRALRCAIAIQEAVERLRAAGRTAFQMGLSIHSGRVFVADFMHDDEHKETTVIGRQVNLAGRISSTQSLWPDDTVRHEEEEGKDSFKRRRESLRTTPPSDNGAVFMDRKGNFYNVGLATSGQFLRDLRESVKMEPFSEGNMRGYRFFDRYLKSDVIFHYVGDAQFKGFRDSTPVYGISWIRVKNTGAERT